MKTAAVIGCGDVSVVHFEAIEALADVELVAVCDVDPDAAARASARYGVPSFASHAELLAAMRPDVVHITTPHDQHVQPAIDALAAGVHVVVEKPVAHTCARRTAWWPRPSNRAHPRSPCASRTGTTRPARRWPRCSRPAELGSVLGGSATVCWHRPPAYYQSRPWRGQVDRSGGGVLINQAIHSVDLLQWLLGEVREVRGQASRLALGDVEVEDTAQIVLDHEGGARSVFFATNANATDSPVTLEIVTEAAELFLRRDLTVRLRRRSRRGRRGTAGRLRRSGLLGRLPQLLIEDFYARLDEPEPFWIGPREASKSLDILSRVYASGISAILRLVRTWLSPGSTRF